MALHRDIYWVGKQWSVTGYGLQTVDQKLKGKFDIEASRLWEDGLEDALLDEKWFSRGDFDRGLAEARKRFPKPPGKTAPKAVPAPVVPALPGHSAKAKGKPKLRPNRASAKYAMRIMGCRAKFLPVWRIRIRVGN
jgi:hypothetical protein